MLPYSDYKKSRALIEVFRLIKSGECNTVPCLANLFETSEDTIKNYVKELQESFDVDIVFNKNKKTYEIDYKESSNPEGILERIKYTQPITADDIILILSSLLNSQTFMETKMEIIKNSLLSLLSDKEANNLRNILHFEKDPTRDDQIIINSIQTIRKAMIEEKKIIFTYRASNGNFKEHIFIPYSFACYAGKYYIIGLKEGKDMLSHYRIDRISSIKISEDQGKISPDFNVYTYLKKTWNMFSGAETKVRVKFPSYCKKIVTEHNLIDGSLVSENKDYFIYDFNCHGTAGIKIWILSFGCNAEVLEPLELRQEICDNINKMMNIYNI